MESNVEASLEILTIHMLKLLHTIWRFGTRNVGSVRPGGGGRARSLPLRGAEESDTLLVRPGAGDLRWPRPLGDMLLPVECSEKTLGDWGMCVPVLPSQVLQ